MQLQKNRPNLILTDRKNTTHSNSSRKTSLRVKLPKNSKLTPFFQPHKPENKLIIEGKSKPLHDYSSKHTPRSRTSSENKNLPIHSNVLSDRMIVHNKQLDEDPSKTRSRITVMEQYGFPLESENRKKTILSPKTPKIIPLKSAHKYNISAQKSKEKSRTAASIESQSLNGYSSQNSMEFTFGLRNCFSIKKL